MRIKSLAIPYDPCKYRFYRPTTKPRFLRLGLPELASERNVVGLHMAMFRRLKGLWWIPFVLVRALND